MKVFEYYFEIKLILILKKSKIKKKFLCKFNEIKAKKCRHFVFSAKQSQNIISSQSHKRSKTKTKTKAKAELTSDPI